MQLSLKDFVILQTQQGFFLLFVPVRKRYIGKSTSQTWLLFVEIDSIKIIDKLKG